jgi:hypothetical protein
MATAALLDAVVVTGDVHDFEHLALTCPFPYARVGAGDPVGLRVAAHAQMSPWAL